MATCEDRVADALFSWFGGRSGCQIIGFHPPSGKAYGTDLVPISRRIDGQPTKERYHIDLIVIEGRFLFLIELKCRLSESREDVIKLRDIASTYTLTELVTTMQRRLTIAIDFSMVEQLVLAVGYEVEDAPLVPDDFIYFCTGNSRTTVGFGSATSAMLRELFR